MKLLTAITAGVVAITGLAATPAAAQSRERVVVRERTVYHHTRNYRRPHRRTVCTVRYRHGERVRTCRTRYAR